MKMISPRTMLHDYFDLKDLPIGEIPFSAIRMALRDEKYLRKYMPDNYMSDLRRGQLSALLYWYHYYINDLYELASVGKDYMDFFRVFPIEIKDGFNYLFGETIKRLDKVKSSAIKSNHLDESSLKKI